MLNLEFALPNVLDSILDVRVVISTDDWDTDDFRYDHILTKVGIDGTYTEPQHVGNLCRSYMPRINFGIYAKYKPVKISWNLEQWQYTCHSGSFLINHPFSETVIGGYGNYLKNFYCLGRDEKEVVWDITNSYRYGWVETFPTEAGTMDTMYLHQIGIKRYDFFDNPCRFSNASDLNEDTEINVYPNPAHDHVYIQSENKFSKVKIYTSDGKLESIIRDVDELTTIDVMSISPGIKIMELIDDFGRVYRRKWVKI
jgi:hypothetical protein